MTRRTPIALTLVALPLFSMLSPMFAQDTPLQHPAADANAALILNRYRQLLLETPPQEAAKLRGWLETLNANGQWPDVDYTDANRASWKTAAHLQRLVALARALAETNSPLSQDPRLPGTINRALDHWLAKRYQNPNWWHNEIGVPNMMRDLLILLGDRLQGQRREGALEVLNQFGRPKPNNGTNTVWEAELGIEYGALTGDREMIRQYSAMIADEIKVTTGEGIQSDGSFHQHGARLQQFHYGNGFLSNSARLGWQLRGTPWAFPPEKLRLLTDMVVNGDQWMVRGLTTVPGTIDRAVSRPGALRSGDIRQSLRFLIETVPDRATELGAVLARQDGEGTPLVGFRAFPRSDFAAYHRPGFSFFLKTVSDRTLLTESINGENLKGQLLNQGDGYILRDGSEYFDLMPVWNWDLLPGITWGSDAGPIQRRPFVGSLSDGQSGLTVMDVAYGDPKAAPKLSAHKFWACHGDVVVALLGDLRYTGDQFVRTALNQALLRGDVTYGDANANGKIKTVSEQMQTVRALWLHHDGMAYVPLGAPDIATINGRRVGNWASINQSESPEPLDKPLFLAFLEHARPQGQNCGYAMFPASTPQVAAQLAAKPTWHVLRNDATCQAVLFEDGTLMATFWQPGQFNEAGHFIGVDKPCLVMESQQQIRVSDPTQGGGPLKLTLGPNRSEELTLPTGGESTAPIRRAK